ncbi:MAG: ATP-dependent helicase [Anaerolineae bacterium]
MDILDGLNPQQLQAVTAPDGPVLVLAGPGSGKTRVLTHRVAYLVSQRDVYPWRIMAVTFTNKAAREMRDRLVDLLGGSQASELTLGTFHATCARILRREAPNVGVSRDYVIFDTSDQLNVVKQAIRELGLDEKKYRAMAVLNAISRAKNELLRPEDFKAGSYYEEVVRRIYERYQDILQLNNGFDFDDLIMAVTLLFDERPDILQQYQERYRYVLVDEFQDTNMAQYVLVLQLTARWRNLLCVADEDQSIYRWRGADYRNIARLRDDFEDLNQIVLEENYRSTQTILDTAGAIIRHNTNRVDKVLFTERGKGTQVVIYEAFDENDEAQFVVDRIADLQRRGMARYGDCAVMYRTNAQSRAIEDAFIRAGMPYRLVGATRFYARREIKDVLAFLRLAHNPSDSVSLARVINVPTRGIGQKTVDQLGRMAHERGVSMWDVLRALSEGGDASPDASPFGTRARRALGGFTAMVEEWIRATEEVTVAGLLDIVVEGSGYRDDLLDGTEEGRERWENVLELRGVAAEYEDMTLTEFLADVALVSDVDNLSDEVDAPTLLTLHAAKGLEFPVVFITGLEEGVLPHQRSFDDPEEMAEERRLMYVGITRAKDRLFLTHVFRRTLRGQSDVSDRSRFLRDIPDGLLQSTSSGASRSYGSSNRGRDRYWGRTDPVTSWRTAPRPAETARVAQFRVGQRVRHARFGEGIVIESRLHSDDEEVSVVFEDAGVKRLLISFARLEKLS